MLGRRKQPAQESPAPAAEERPGAKNRPTPRRREAEAANKRPLVGADRKVAGKQSKEEQRLARLKAREAMAAGDERYLPARDKGPVRRFVRDVVDARRNIGEYMLPVMLVVLTLSLFTGKGRMATLVFFGMYLVVLVAVIDGVLLGVRIRKAVTAKFGADAARGQTMYGVMRAFQLRRSRMPKPQVERGQQPR